MLWWLSSIRIPKSNGSQAIKRWLRSVRIFSIIKSSKRRGGRGFVRQGTAVPKSDHRTGTADPAPEGAG